MALDPPPPLPHDAGLFLDFDGTLVALAVRPDGVVVDDALPRLLAGLCSLLDGRLAIVTGRSLAQIDEMLGEAVADLALAGSHGAERRWQGRLHTAERPAALAAVERAFDEFAADHGGLIVERKTLGVALHYRLHPEAGKEADRLARTLAALHGLYYQPGKMMAELRTGGADKGLAIAALAASPPFTGSRPVFLGDDVTDEPGFRAAAAAGGYGIMVGEARATEARYRLPDVAAVRKWLGAAVAGARAA